MIDSTSQTKIRRFQSTPSAWRETTPVNQFIRYQTFQSTPSAWRETTSESSESESPNISIHSLRMEGDRSRLLLDHVSGISIHSLRMEGDGVQHTGFSGRCISIHSLRMEGDSGFSRYTSAALEFQSTPSAWRETQFDTRSAYFHHISIHSLRMEGDAARRPHFPAPVYFNPLPPHGGRHARFLRCPLPVHFNPLPPHGGRPLMA